MFLGMMARNELLKQLSRQVGRGKTRLFYDIYSFLTAVDDAEQVVQAAKGSLDKVSPRFRKRVAMALDELEAVLDSLETATTTPEFKELLTALIENLDNEQAWSSILLRNLKHYAKNIPLELHVDDGGTVLLINPSDSEVRKVLRQLGVGEGDLDELAQHVNLKPLRRFLLRLASKHVNMSPSLDYVEVFGKKLYGEQALSKIAVHLNLDEVDARLTTPWYKSLSMKLARELGLPAGEIRHEIPKTIDASYSGVAYTYMDFPIEHAGRKYTLRLRFERSGLHPHTVEAKLCGDNINVNLAWLELKSRNTSYIAREVRKVVIDSGVLDKALADISSVLDAAGQYGFRIEKAYGNMVENQNKYMMLELRRDTTKVRVSIQYPSREIHGEMDITLDKELGGLVTSAVLRYIINNHISNDARLYLKYGIANKNRRTMKDIINAGIKPTNSALQLFAAVDVLDTELRASIKKLLEKYRELDESDYAALYVISKLSYNVSTAMAERHGISPDFIAKQGEQIFQRLTGVKPVSTLDVLKAIVEKGFLDVDEASGSFTLFGKKVNVLVEKYAGADMLTEANTRTTNWLISKNLHGEFFRSLASRHDVIPHSVVERFLRTQDAATVAISLASDKDIWSKLAEQTRKTVLLQGGEQLLKQAAENGWTWVLSDKQLVLQVLKNKLSETNPSNLTKVVAEISPVILGEKVTLEEINGEHYISYKNALFQVKSIDENRIIFIAGFRGRKIGMEVSSSSGLSEAYEKLADSFLDAYLEYKDLVERAPTISSMYGVSIKHGEYKTSAFSVPYIEFHAPRGGTWRVVRVVLQNRFDEVVGKVLHDLFDGLVADTKRTESNKQTVKS